MTRIRLAARLLAAAGNLYPSLIASTICRIVNQLLGIALLVLAARAITDAAGGQAVRIGALAAWLVGIALVKAGLRYLEHYLGHRVAFTALQRLRELFFDRLAPQAPAATTGRAGAELTARASGDIDRIEVFFAHTFPPAVSAILVPTIALTWVGTAVDSGLAVAIAIVILVMVAAPVLLSRSTWRTTGEVAEAHGDVAARIGDDVHGVREVLAFGVQEKRLAALDEDSRRLNASSATVARIQAGRSAVLVALQLTGLIVITVVAVRTTAPVAAVTTALAVFAGLWVPVRGIEKFSTGLDTALAAASRVWETIEAEPAVRDLAGTGGSGGCNLEKSGEAGSTDIIESAGSGDISFAGPAQSLAADIVVEGVSLRYPGRTDPALSEVSADFPARSWSAVVGVSGSGKSSLAMLLVRGRDPDAGTIRLGEVDVRGLPLDRLRKRIAFVTQHPRLLRENVAENLRLAAPDADASTVTEALRVVALEDWIASLPEGLETGMQSGGLTVSGGQLQRLAIARALIGGPEVLVLDEALSQLDAASARTVRDRLGEARPELTVIEVTHRADLLPDETTVLVMDEGRVVEQGRAADLRRAGGAFVRVEARNDPGS